MWRDSETNLDLLDFDYLIEITKDIILNDSLTPSSIGVYGNWGSGKSSLMEMVQASLAKDKKILCLKFNGWLFEGYEDAKTALLGSILDRIAEEKRLTAKAKELLTKLYKNVDFLKLASKGTMYGLDLLVTGGIGTVTDLTVQSVISNAKGKLSGVKEKEVKEALDSTFKSGEIRKNVKLFHKDFAELLSLTKIKKLVVFIDELDRCNHDTILQTLEAIRLFLFTNGTSFIIGADERQVIYAVRKKFPEVQGNKIDIGKEYLEKIIQYPVKIPQLNPKEVQFYITCLFFQDILTKEEYDPLILFIQEEKKKEFLKFEITYELLEPKFPKILIKLKEVISLSKQISSVLAQSLNGNPRHCKRFLNALSMRLKMAKFKNINLDQRVLSKIMLLEYFKSELYKEIGALQSVENGKLIELGFAENENWEKLEKLKLWKDDTWFKNWIKIEPNLAGIDLQPYYYFTRESLSSKTFMVASGLSPDAIEVLNGLMSESDSMRENALKKATRINDFEASEILKSLIHKIETSSEVSTNIYRSFIEWGKCKVGLYSEVVACLKRIPASKIRASFIPRTFGLGKYLKKEAEIKEILSDWEKENTKLKSAIQTELNK